MNTEEKEHALFSVPWEEPPSPRLGEDFETDIFGIPPLETVDCETLYLFISKTDKACFGNLCMQGKPFRQGSPGERLGLLHLRVKELTTVL